MEIINVEVEKETKELLERLVRKKAYSSISEAVRQIINDHLSEHPELFSYGINLDQMLEEARKMSDSEYERLTADIFERGGREKTAAEIVRDSRGRS